MIQSNTRLSVCKMIVYLDHMFFSIALYIWMIFVKAVRDTFLYTFPDSPPLFVLCYKSEIKSHYIQYIFFLFF